MISRRTAQAFWERTPPVPTTYAAFVGKINTTANDEQFEELLVLATVDDLRDLVRDLRKRLAGAEFAARVQRDTVAAQQTQIREMNALRRQRKGDSGV